MRVDAGRERRRCASAGRAHHPMVLGEQLYQKCFRWCVGAGRAHHLVSLAGSDVDDGLLPCGKLAGQMRWSGWPMRGWRIGEAGKPGPGRTVDERRTVGSRSAGRSPANVLTRIVVANVTSWGAGWRGLIKADADVYCVQEARIAAEGREVAASEASGRGLVLRPGDAVDGEHLLAFAHKEGLRHLRSVELVGVELRMRERMQYAVVHFGRKRALHIIQLYGLADGSRASIDFNVSIVTTAVGWLRSLGDVPALVVGDFNLNLAEVALDGPLAMAGWVDVFSNAGPTCIPSNGAPSRIDYVLASRPARDLIERISIRWDLGLATHAALILEMRAEAPEKAWMRRPVQPLDGPQSTNWGEDQAAATATIVSDYGPSVRNAIAAGDFNRGWSTLERAMREWLAKRRGDHEVPARRYANAKWCAEVPRTSGRDGEAQSRTADQALLRVRRLRAFWHSVGQGSRLWSRSQFTMGQVGVLTPQNRDLPHGSIDVRMGCLPYQARCILDALVAADRDNPLWSPAWCEFGHHPFAAYAPLLDRAERELKEAAQESRRTRKDAWFKWVTDSLEDRGGRLYRWIRGGAASAAVMVPDPQAGGDDARAGSRAWILSLRGGPSAQLRTLETHWRKLWQRPYDRPVPEEWLEELDALPPFPERTVWTVEGVKGILRRMAKRKASGLDGWTVAELRLLPDELLGLIVLMFEAIEAGGSWPEQLKEPEGLLLPKGVGDLGDPMDRRPIWLLPMLYRVWAAGRAQLFARWRASWPDGDGGFGAEELAWELALDLEAAEANGEDICGAALDWRKAFDNVPLCNLDPLLTRAGVPDWIRRPLVAAYTAQRRLRVEGALGQRWKPTSGILPGCALAVFVLSVMVRPWDRKVARIHDSLRRRIYVDDLAFWARGLADDVAPAITEGLEVTKLFQDAMGWCLHTGKGKSAQFANTASVRAWLKSQCAEVEVTTHVKDLGVVATAGRRARTPVTAGRMGTAIGRMKRVACLPVPFERRCQLAAASGTAAGIYGAACGAPPARELESLRRAARVAVCHGGSRAAPEIVFGLLSPTWRLDPKAVTVIAPIWQAVKAIRDGRLQMSTWRTTVNAVEAGQGRRVGPVAAALRGMVRLGIGTNIEKWAGVRCAPQGWVPADRTKSESLKVLLEAWRGSQWRELAERRGDFAHVTDGVDEWATKRVLSGGVKGVPRLPPDAAGALRTVLAGNVVTERIAAHWTTRSACPHCGLEVEDHEHRFWRCPAWEGARTAALGGPGASMALRGRLDAAVARTGVLAAQPELVALAEAASVAPMHMPVTAEELIDAALPGDSGQVARRKIWSDGSCVHPLDPLMARAAWGLHVQGVGGAQPLDLAGPVDRAQTAQRAELAAALAATRAVRQPIELISDSQWVVRSIARIAAGADPIEWKHADLWVLLVPAIRQKQIFARWTPAHKTAEEYTRRGLQELDRLGNAAADANATAMATTRLPPQNIVERRDQQLRSLAEAQRVIAFTELAALKANHGNGSTSAPRIKRRWADVRRGVRAAWRGSAATAAASISAAEVQRRPVGELPSPLHELKLDGAILGCSSCGKTAVKARWTSLAYGRCAANAGDQQLTWRRVPHEIVEDASRISCTRCGGSVPLCRRSTFDGKRCPAWKTEPPDPNPSEVLDWGAWYLHVMGHRVAGNDRPQPRGATAAAEPEARDPPVPGHRAQDVQALLTGEAWRPHVAAQGPGHVACISCGSTARSWARLQAAPCNGWRARLPPRVAALVLLGSNIVRAGGPPARFAALLSTRLNEQPRPPD
jgi:ribonuclease HI/endonuclease/exonuclease/phosphatase family metal-dependent hydrolase